MLTGNRGADTKIESNHYCIGSSFTGLSPNDHQFKGANQIGMLVVVRPRTITYSLLCLFCSWLKPTNNSQKWITNTIPRIRNQVICSHKSWTTFVAVNFEKNPNHSNRVPLGSEQWTVISRKSCEWNSVLEVYRISMTEFVIRQWPLRPVRAIVPVWPPPPHTHRPIFVQIEKVRKPPRICFGIFVWSKPNWTICIRFAMIARMPSAR